MQRRAAEESLTDHGKDNSNGRAHVGDAIRHKPGILGFLRQIGFMGATGERIAALEGIGEMPRTARGSEKTPGDIAGSGAAKEGDGRASSPKDRELAVPDRGKGAGMDFGL